MSKKKSYLFHYALLIFATSLLSFWCFKTMGNSGSMAQISGWMSLSTLLSLILSALITLVSILLFRRHTHLMHSIAMALNRMAAGHWETIPETDNPVISAYNQSVRNLQEIVREHEHQKEQLRQDINHHATALKDSGDRLSQAMAELKNTQNQMAQSEKHRSLSAVVSGFAHEINNPLTGILGYIELMELQSDLTDMTRKRLASMKAQALRIKGIISDLSQLDPDGKQVKMPISIPNLIEKLTKITLAKTDKSQVTLETELCSVETLVYGNHFALWQVFEGLLENAIEACRENRPSDGHILIETRCDSGRHTVVTIRDNGGGFKEPGKAFDPFYTTKSRTHKRGIGLSLAYKIVVEHGGSICIKNLEKGASVSVTLPLQAPKIDNRKK